MAKTKLSIFLIKEGFTPQEIVKDGIGEMSLANGNILYYKERFLAPPRWLLSFFNDANIDEDKLLTKSVSVVILYEIGVSEEKKRFFALCFGSGKSLLHQRAIEGRFGLRVTLNCVDPKSLRSVDTTTLDVVLRNNRIQSSALGEITNFNVDFNRDLLKNITGKSVDKLLLGTLSGSDSLSVTTDKNYDDMQSFLKRCYEAFISDAYKEKFDGIDQMYLVKDKSLIRELYEIVLHRLKSPNPEKVWVSIPEINDYSLAESFQLKSEELYSDIDIGIVTKEYGQEIDLKDLSRFKIYCLDANGDITNKWSLRKCLYADIDFCGRQYVLNEEKWYEVNNDYSEKINLFYSKAELSNIHLPDCHNEKECDYNKRVADSNPTQFFLMDRKLIILDRSKIEFCDLYTIDKQIIHVKKYMGSSVLSHLFAQGMVSANLLFDHKFRTEVNKHLDGNFKVPEDQSIKAEDYTIVYAIIKKDTKTGERPDIPFFSKINFYTHASLLSQFGYHVHLLGINNIIT